MTLERDVLVSYRIRTVRIAVYATYMAVILMALMPALPGHPRIMAVPYTALCAAGIAGASAFGFLVPWPRLLEVGWGERIFYAWSAVDIVLVTLACAVSSGPTSFTALLYVLTTIFFAASYPTSGQVVLFLFTCACYGALALTWPHPVNATFVVAVMAVSGMVWFMAAFLARERTREMAGHHEARALAEHRADLLSAVVRTASRTSLDSDAVVRGVVDSVVGIGYDLANFSVLEDGGQYYRMRYARGLPEDLTGQAHPIHLGVVALVTERRTTVVMDDYPTHLAALPAIVELGVKATIGAPVWVAGELAAILVGGSTTNAHLPDTDVEVFEILASHIGRALENAGRFEAEHAAMARAQEDSRRDELTGLGNRRHANALLTSLRPGDAVVLIDLDHFKLVNDHRGHATGDRALVELAAHLRNAVRGGDDVARYGGEEFLVVLRQVGDDALGATERLLQAWRSSDPMTTFSAGVAPHSQDHPPDITLGRADAALYAAKLLGRDRACLYGPDLDLDNSIAAD